MSNCVKVMKNTGGEMLKNIFLVMIVLILSGCGGGSSSSGKVVDKSDNKEMEEIVENNALLSWSHPSTRENGESLSLSEIKHYIISHRFNNEVTEYEVPYPEENYKIKDLAEGTHYFTIITVDTEDRKSKPSEEVFKTI